MVEKKNLLLVIKISILFLLIIVLYHITHENNSCHGSVDVNGNGNRNGIETGNVNSQNIEIDSDHYQCDPTNKTVTNSKEHTPDRNCLLQKGTSGCNQTHFGGVEQVKHTVENVIASSKESCQGLVPRRTSRIQEDCHYVSPYLLRDN